MKKFIITLLLAALPAVTFAQSAFDKFSNVDGIEAVTISGKMFEMLGSVEAGDNDAETQKVLNQVKNLDNLKIFSTAEKKYRKEIRTAVTNYLKTNALEELMSVKDGKSTIRIYVKQGASANIVKEGLLFVEDADDKQVVLISFTGTLNLNDLKDLKGFKGSKGAK
ncbi:DUF4252 domain-containing protein [Flavobacterium subsaxonicum]|uniref:DUF4252 domain-containing protein n=1 Tax=Flavobacterium subsaxonicum TaxID=426226 RepID=UPI000405B17A|nr:DUF4252 domain-containing protein [Flavobacterium subsaxonicum]